MEFPKDFLWGTATSAHQIEGNNTNSDWWRWETSDKETGHKPSEPSGEACDSYNRYTEDFELCQKMNNNAVRISIEWARIEPRQGIFDNKAIEHYKKVLSSAREKGLKTSVTLHHFTNPIWLAEQGGWLNFSTPGLFAKYAQKCAQELGDLCDFISTINEPQVYASMSYIAGIWPPNKKNPLSFLIVQLNMIRAHNKAYKKIKSVCDKPVGIVKNISWYEHSSFIFLDSVIAKIAFYMNGNFFLDAVARCCDFIGLNYYFTNRIVKIRKRNPDTPINDLGWWINYDGLFKTLMSLKKYNKPVYVTENGLADSNDKLRSEFIKKMLLQVHAAISHGVKVKGYFHWSLLDNFEWHHGFWPRFGLVEIDRNENLKRIPRKSFYDYAEICKNGIVRGV